MSTERPDLGVGKTGTLSIMAKITDSPEGLGQWVS